MTALSVLAAAASACHTSVLAAVFRITWLLWSCTVVIEAPLHVPQLVRRRLWHVQSCVPASKSWHAACIGSMLTTRRLGAGQDPQPSLRHTCHGVRTDQNPQQSLRHRFYGGRTKLNPQQSWQHHCHAAAEQKHPFSRPSAPAAGAGQLVVARAVPRVLVAQQLRGPRNSALQVLVEVKPNPKSNPDIKIWEQDADAGKSTHPPAPQLPQQLAGSLPLPARW